MNQLANGFKEVSNKFKDIDNGLVSKYLMVLGYSLSKESIGVIVKF